MCYWTQGRLQDRSQNRLLDIVDKRNCQSQWSGQCVVFPEVGLLHFGHCLYLEADSTVMQTL